MKTINILLDYKNRFSSKYIARPYRSGMDKTLLYNEFLKNGFNVNFLSYTDIDFRVMTFEGEIFLYTSSEDDKLFYKDYIEDILLGIQQKGGILIPQFKYFRAHHNKVFMEILRDCLTDERFKTIKSSYFGTIEDLKKNVLNFNYPVVLKSSAGAVSTGVTLAQDPEELIRKAKKMMRSRNLWLDIWDIGRSIKWNNYIRDSVYRRKIIVQNFIEGLKEDWKILVFGSKYYVLHRKVRPNDFRASGSGLISYKEDLPSGMLDFACDVFSYFNVPNMGMDIAFDGNRFHLLEFQFVSFGTHTLDTAPFYFEKNNNKWDLIRKKSIVEEEYVKSVINYLNYNKEP